MITDGLPNKLTDHPNDHVLGPTPNSVITIEALSFLAPTLPCAPQINLHAMQLSKHFKGWPLQQYCNGNMLVLLSAFLFYFFKDLGPTLWTLQRLHCCIGMPRRRAPRMSLTLNRRTLVKPASQPSATASPPRPIYSHAYPHTSLGTRTATTRS